MNREEPYLSTYLHSKGRKLGLPVSGNFELTARCNFRCPMCYIHGADEGLKARELSAEVWLSLASQAVKRGMIFALLTGGEPFIREDFFEIFRGMKKMGLMISINSNGSLLNEEIIDRLAEDPPFRMNISLYGASDATYKNMCGIPCHDRVVENIRSLRAHGIDTRLNVSLTEYNSADLEKILKTAKELGVHVKASSYMYPPTRYDKSAGSGRLTAEQAAEVSVRYDTLRFTDDEFRGRAENMRKGVCRAEECPGDPTAEGISCRAGNASFWLTWEGKMLPCGLMKAPVAYPLEAGFDAAWDRIREKSAAIRLPSACSSCAKRNMCSICAAISESETGGYDTPPEYVCEMTEDIYRFTLEEAERRFGGKND